jgi:hypothetical protein
VITYRIAEEFLYKANYETNGKEKRPNNSKELSPFSGKELGSDKYSQNYFESMFHPIYYKLF